MEENTATRISALLGKDVIEAQPNARADSFEESHSPCFVNSQDFLNPSASAIKILAASGSASEGGALSSPSSGTVEGEAYTAEPTGAAAKTRKVDSPTAGDGPDGAEIDEVQRSNVADTEDAAGAPQAEATTAAISTPELAAAIAMADAADTVTNTTPAATPTAKAPPAAKLAGAELPSGPEGFGAIWLDMSQPVTTMAVEANQTAASCEVPLRSPPEFADRQPASPAENGLACEEQEPRERQEDHQQDPCRVEEPELGDGPLQNSITQELFPLPADTQVHASTALDASVAGEQFIEERIASIQKEESNSFSEPAPTASICSPPSFRASSSLDGAFESKAGGGSQTHGAFEDLDACESRVVSSMSFSNNAGAIASIGKVDSASLLEPAEAACQNNEGKLLPAARLEPVSGAVGNAPQSAPAGSLPKHESFKVK